MNDNFSAKFRVYFEDTDAGGIVYYANYLKFCERARSEWLRQDNFSQQELLEKNACGFVVYEIHGRYLKSAKLDDELLVTVKPVQLKRLSLTMFQEVYNQRGQKLFELTVTLAYTDLKKGKPKAIDPQIRAFIEKRIDNDPEKKTDK
ncbi:MAG: YbgC/FadM family acyl-CoA thioesterase [Succinatimonas sp.]|nr:YbgC/FadM family acyl-CoA thioesterase [Succinatimonas sp.]